MGAPPAPDAVDEDGGGAPPGAEDADAVPGESRAAQIELAIPVRTVYAPPGPLGLKLGTRAPSRRRQGRSRWSSKLRLEPRSQPAQAAPTRSPRSSFIFETS